MRGKKARLLRQQTQAPGRGRTLYLSKTGSGQMLASPARLRYQRLKKATRGISVGFLMAAYRHYSQDAGDRP